MHVNKLRTAMFIKSRNKEIIKNTLVKVAIYNSNYSSSQITNLFTLYKRYFEHIYSN